MSEAQEELAIEYVALDQLIPYARNARTHDDSQVAQIAASIREFGWTNPVLIDGRNGVIAGHGRLLAARKLGMDAVPCIELSGLSEAQKRAYVLADNKLALNADWDMAMLATELADLDTGDFDMSLIGFSDSELENIATFAGIGDGAQSTGTGSLADRFMIPPFSVLNAREGWWQDRKRAWVALGIKSELGRGGTEADASFKNQAAQRGLMSTRQPNAIPGGAMMPLDRAKQAGRGRPING